MERWTRLSLQHPRAVLALLAVITIGFAIGLRDLRPEYGYRVLIGADHPAVVKLEAFIDIFGGGQPVNIAWECGDARVCEHPLDRTSVRMAHDVGRQLAALPSVRRVASAANTSVIVPDKDGFAVRQLVEDGELAGDFDALAARAAEDPLWRGTLVNEAGTGGAIVLQTDDTSPSTESLLADAVLAALAPYEAKGFDFFIAGAAIDSVVSGRALDESVTRLIPVLVLVIGVVLFLLARSWQQAVVALGSMGVALIWTFGLLGWLQWPQDGILEVLAPLVLTVGVCDAVHFLTRATELERDQGTRHAALVAAAREVGPACLVTTATTSAAFLSFTTSDLDTFIRFGFIAGFGVIGCLVTTFTLLPILAAWIPAPTHTEAGTPHADKRLERAILRSTAMTQRRPGAVLLGVALLTAISFGGIARLHVDNNWTKSFGEESVVGRWKMGFKRIFGHSSSIDMTFTLPSSSMLVEPSTFTALHQIARTIDDTTAFTRPVGLSDSISRLNRALHDDDLDFDRSGGDARANAELIEMLALDDAEMLNTWLSIDHRTTRLSFDSPLDSHADRAVALDVARRTVEALLPRGWTYSFEGEAPTHAHFVEDVLGTQLRSFPTAALLVWVLICCFLRSIPLGSASLVPTLLPVTWTLGLMGWAGMDLDIGRSMVAAVVIGIGVDDSIHLLRRYQEAREAGHNMNASMTVAIADCGRALVSTSLALAAGFLVLRVAAWKTISSFGGLVAFTISVALVCTMVVLPAMFALTARRARSSDISPEHDRRTPRLNRGPGRRRTAAALPVGRNRIRECRTTPDTFGHH